MASFLSVSIFLLICTQGALCISILNNLIKINLGRPQAPSNKISLKIDPGLGKLLMKTGALSDSLFQGEEFYILQLSEENLQKIGSSLLPLRVGEVNTNNLILWFGGTDSVLKEIDRSQFANSNERQSKLVLGLQRHASQQQFNAKSVTQILGISQVLSFWSGNKMGIRDATLEVLYILTAVPEVTAIIKEPILQLMVMPRKDRTSTVRIDTQGASSIQGNDSVQWNIEKIQVPAARAKHKVAGEGTVVANIDTGVEGTHEALTKNFRGNTNSECASHSWFDPYHNTTFPNDDDGHGTHTMGTVCGDKGIGVAPGALWIACKGCDPNGCEGLALFSCWDFMMAPTLVDGETNPRPDCRPDVVSNSWGGLPDLGDTFLAEFFGDNFLNAELETATKCGIFHDFAIGNSGPSCATTCAPGNQPQTMGVAATDAGDFSSYFSSKGPSANDTSVKPGISAPGENITSCYNGNNTDYRSLDGTSMACPHVAGVAALVISFARKSCGNTPVRLPYDRIKQTLEQSAKFLPQSFNWWDLVTACPSPENMFDKPNYVYGHGRVDALEAMNALEKLIKDDPKFCEKLTR